MYGPFFLTHLHRQARVTQGPGSPRHPRARRHSGQIPLKLRTPPSPAAGRRPAASPGTGRSGNGYPAAPASRPSRSPPRGKRTESRRLLLPPRPLRGGRGRCNGGGMGTGRDSGHVGKARPVRRAPGERKAAKSRRIPPFAWERVRYPVLTGRKRRKRR